MYLNSPMDTITDYIEEASLADAAILALWDNISGPRTAKVWQKHTLEDEAVKKIANFLVSGEVAMDDNSVYVWWICDNEKQQLAGSVFPSRVNRLVGWWNGSAVIDFWLYWF